MHAYVITELLTNILIYGAVNIIVGSIVSHPNALIYKTEVFCCMMHVKAVFKIFCGGMVTYENIFYTQLTLVSYILILLYMNSCQACNQLQ